MSRFVPVNATVYGAPVFRDTENAGPYYTWKVNRSNYFPFFPSDSVRSKLEQSEMTGEAIVLDNSEASFRQLPDGWVDSQVIQEFTGGGTFSFYPVTLSVSSVQQSEITQNDQVQTGQASSTQNTGTQNTGTQNTSAQSSGQVDSEIDATPTASIPSTGDSAQTSASDDTADEPQSDSSGGLIVGALLIGALVIAARNRRNYQ